MSTWAWVLIAGVTSYGIKAAGYLLPRCLLENRYVPMAASAVTVGLLASLVATNAVASGQSLALDSRLLAAGAAALALALRAPFIVVVIVGAVAAALGRLCGLP